MKTAVVLAGGRGTRLWPLTERIPKPMIPIDERPIMEFVVGALRSSGIRRLLVVLQYNPGPIVEHFASGERFGLAIDYILQDGDVGTAGGVRQALEFIGEEDFVVVSSDILFHGDLLAGQAFHHEKKSDLTIALSIVDDPSEFGTVVRNPDGRIRDFHEKPPREGQGPVPVSTGVYFLRRHILDRVVPGAPMDFGRQLFPSLVLEGLQVYGWDLPGYWQDIGTFQRLSAARRDAREIPALRNLVTRWPAERSGEGGRIWIRRERRTRAWEWLEVDVSTIGTAAGFLSNWLAERRGGAATISELESLKELEATEALAAAGWLEREGKVRFQEDGRTTRVFLLPLGSIGAEH